MSDKELEIFNLCERLAELLGDKEAIADLKKLYNKHPEMFNNMQEVSSTIKEVVKEPDLIKINPKAKNDKDFMVAKALDSKKMGDIGIRNDEGINVVFHANKKNISQLNKFKKEAQILVETPSANAAPTWLDHCADNPDGLPKCDKAPSISANEIIPQPKDKAKQNPTQNQANFDLNEFNKLSLAEKLAQLQRNQESISQMPKASEVFNKDSNSLQNPKEQKDSKDLQQEKDLKELDSKESTFKHQHKRK